MEIPLIYIKGVRMSDVTVPNIFVPNWQSQQPSVDHLVPPVVLNIGNPIVDMPGCVKAHQDNQYHKSGLPVDRNLVEDDPDKAMIVCDATVPSYDAMNYEPEQFIFITEVEPPAVEPPPEPPEAEAPDTGDVKSKVMGSVLDSVKPDLGGIAGDAIPDFTGPAAPLPSAPTSGGVGLPPSF